MYAWHIFLSIMDVWLDREREEMDTGFVEP